MKAKITSELPSSVITHTKHSIINSVTLPNVGLNSSLVLLPVILLMVVNVVLMILLLMLFVLLVDDNSI